MVPAMTLYLRFMITLAFGLIGLGFVLKMALDHIFHDWDVVAELKAWWTSEGRNLRHSRIRAEDLLLEAEKQRTPTVTTRLLEQRREQLREIGAVEYRLQLSNRQPVVLTPLTPPPVNAGVPSETAKA